ncbi:hypothetical protein M2G88_21890 [Vibrio vulnificus]|nr:hypothetical protein [Vibrio vulnificus]
MNSCILFIFEGAKAEPNITINLCQHLIETDGKRVVRASYGFNIYKLHKELSKDPDLDIYELLVEQINSKTTINKYDQSVLDIGDSENITDIYMFFDYDIHCTNASNIKLSDMLNRFDNPQNDGLLCVSYPMVEALKHQEGKAPTYLTHSILDLENYKKWLNKSIREGNLDKRYQNWSDYTLEIWSEIIHTNLIRANKLTTDNFTLPKQTIEQIDIFNSQMSKHIPNNEVAVISGFPLMLLEFYGDNLATKTTIYTDSPFGNFINTIISTLVKFKNWFESMIKH